MLWTRIKRCKNGGGRGRLGEQERARVDMVLQVEWESREIEGNPIDFA